MQISVKKSKVTRGALQWTPKMATGEAPARQRTLRFGEFELDLDRQTLSRRGIPLKLQRQPCQVLALLIERAPETVSRDQIRRHVWGEIVHIDVDQSINFCVRQIRAALRDSPAGPRFIETLPREGYRFLGSLEGIAKEDRAVDLAAAPAKEELLHSAVRSNPRRWLTVSTISVLLLLLGTTASWLLKRQFHLTVSGISPVTSYPGDEREPSFSPDGRQVAFSWNGDGGRRHIYVALSGEEHPLRLTQDVADDSFPAWSPDGKQIAFLRRRSESEFDIMLIPAIGGQERTLHGVRVGLSVAGANRLLAWSPDGKSLCFTSELGPSTHHALFLMSLDSRRVRPIYPQATSPGGDTAAAFSPDGRWLAFARFANPYNSNILVQRLTVNLEPDGEPWVMPNTSGNATTPVWLPDSKQILFLDHDGERIMHAQVGGAAKLIYVASHTLNGLTLDGTGMHLISSRLELDADIETLPLKGLQVAGEAKRIVHSTAKEDHPQFSPNGRWLAFQSNRSGASELWVADSDGEHARQLTHIGAYIAGYPRWSPDSNLLVYHARLPDVAQVYTIRVRDGIVHQITHRNPGFALASFSSDGKLIYMTEGRADGPLLSRVPADGGSPQSFGSGCDPWEAPGRQLLLYRKFDQPWVYARSLVGDASKNPEMSLVNDSIAAFSGLSVVEDGFYYVGFTLGSRLRTFRFYSFALAKSVDIGPAPPNYLHDVAITPDRTRLAYTTGTSNGDLIQFNLN
ncbi:MAG: winged helix-turn-helix domain-containing protein [Bryobacteraceae bacterium]